MVNRERATDSIGRSRKPPLPGRSGLLQRIVCEALENRTMLSASVWTGAGGNADFSTPGNWQNDAVPASGASVTFPSSAASFAVTVDSNVSLGSITISGSGYDITGSAVTLSGGLVATGSSSEIDSNLTLSGYQTINVSAGTLILTGILTDNGSNFGITKTGTGTLDLTGSSTYTGSTNISTGVLQVDGRLTSSVHLASGTTLDGNGRVAGITSSGGTTMPGLNYTAGLLGDSGSIILNSASTLSFELDGNTAGTGNYFYGQLSTGGNVALGGATLSLSLGPDYTPSIGDSLTLISNSGSTTTGSFAGLPQGSLITLGGHYVFRISYSAGAGHDTAISFVRATTVTLSDSTSSSVIGQPVTFTATVTPTDGQPGTPTGTVTFFDNGNPIGSAVTLNGSGQASISDSALSLGSNTITASYGGNTSFQAATSAGMTQTVTAAATTTSLNSSTGSSVWGQSVTFTATVSVTAPGSGTASGTVQFYADGNPIGSPVALSAGSASYSTATLAVGSRSVTADFVSSSGNYIASNSTALYQSVSQSTTTTAITSSTANSVVGQAVTFTASVTASGNGAGLPTGSVTFMDSGMVIGTANLDGSASAAFTISTLAVASHSISAVYNGDGNFLTSQSASVSLTVAQASTQVSVTTPDTPAVYGQTATLTATVSVLAPGSGTPTGSATFTLDGSVIGTVALSNGIATISAGVLSAGNHSISVSYSGDANYAGSTSSEDSLTVADGGTTVAISSSSLNTVWGESVTLAALPAGDGSNALTGTVTFFDGTTQIGSGTFDGVDPVAITIASLEVGSHSITAVFSGNNDYLGSTSAVITQVVARADPAIALASSADSVNAGTTVDLTATVTAVTAASGTVDFFDGTTLIGTGDLTDGIATLDNVSLAGGSHSITASYEGDTHFNAVTSTDEVVNVAAPGVLQFGSATYTVNETDGTATITVTRELGSDGAVGASYAVTGGTAVNGVDFALADGTVSFGDGQATASITVSISDDGRYGNDKSIVISLSSPTGGASLGNVASATLTIDDNNAEPSLAVSNPVITLSANGTGIATFTVTLSAPADVAVEVGYATADGSITAGSGNYTATSGQLVFAPGTTTQTVSVAVNGTSTPGVNQTFNLTLTGPSNATLGSATGTATIVNNNFADPTAANLSDLALPGSGAIFTPLSSDDSHDGGTLTLGIVMAPQYGSVSLVTVKGIQEFFYTPRAGAVESDSFNYSVTDSHGDTSTATATIVYQGVGLVISPLNPALTDLAAVGSNETIKFTQTGKKVKVTFNGVNQGTFAPTGRIVAFTGAGNDTVTAAGVTRSVWLYAGSGNDTLTGGSAADVLVGGSGSDLLNGGAGRNILIAGSGRSILKSSGTDILIAGTTAYDSPTAANQAALNSVLADWSVHSKSSLSLLKNNPGGAALNATSVIGGNTGDTLEGNTSSWFFGDFTYEGGTDTFSDGRRAKKGHQLVPTATELVTLLDG